MARVATVGDVFREQFPALDLDGITKLAGLSLPADFTVTVWSAGVLYAGANAVTITEIAGSAGEYEVEFTPDAAGYWKIEVIIDLISDLQVIEFDASVAGVGLASVDVASASIGRDIDAVRVPAGTAYRVSYSVPAAAGALTVDAKVRKAGESTWTDLTLVEISVPAGHQRIFEVDYMPTAVGWYYLSFSCSIAGWDSSRTFYAYGIEGAIQTKHTSRSLGA